MYINNRCALYENLSSSVASVMNLCVQVYGFELGHLHVVVLIINVIFNVDIVTSLRNITDI